MHPVAYIDLASVIACVIAVALLIRGWKRSRFSPAIRILLVVLLALMTYYQIALFLEWSGVTTRLDWMEDFAGVFLPFVWAFVFYAFVKNAVEEELRTSRERMDLALRGADLGTWDWSVRTDRVIFDEPWAQMLGYTLDELAPQVSTWERLVHPDDLPRIKEVLNQHLEGHTDSYETEHRLRHKSGRWVWVLDKGRVIERDRDGKPLRACGTHLDITARKQAETALMAYQRRLRSLASELSLAEERERRRIAAGLHDYACQNLVLSKMQLQGLREPLPTAGTDEIADVCSTLDRTLESVRALVFDLSSPTLYKFGLESALEELLEDKVKAQHGLKYTFRDDGAAKPLAEDVRILLFQSVRELLINTIKHAQAHAVTVDIARHDGSIRITVADDGVGFDVIDVLTDPSRSHGFGLFHIKERLDFIGGRLDIASQPGEGSRIALMAHLETATSVVAETHDRTGQAPSDERRRRLE